MILKRRSKMPPLLIECAGKIIKYQGTIGVFTDMYHDRPSKIVSGRLIDIDNGNSSYIRTEESERCTIAGTADLKGMTAESRAKLLHYAQVSGCTVGGDPEIFVVDKDGIVIPAFKFLPNKKAAKQSGEGVFWDGFQAEFTVPHGGCLAYFTDATHYQLVKLWKAARAFDRKCQFTYKSVMDIPTEVMADAKPEHIELGCAPSKNVYNTPSIQVQDPAALPIRFAGCHFHFGLSGRKEEEKINMIKAADAIFGIMSVSMFQKVESPLRRMYYGRAGEYRFPSHGIEYRTPSSAVLVSPVVYHFSYDMTRAAIFLGLNYPIFKLILPVKEDVIVGIINNYDIPKAKKVIKSNEAVFAGLIKRRYSNYHENTHKALLDMIYSGVDNFFDINAIHKNWYLDGSWHTHSDNKNGCVYRWSPEKKLEEE